MLKKVKNTRNMSEMSDDIKTLRHVKMEEYQNMSTNCQKVTKYGNVNTIFFIQ